MINKNIPESFRLILHFDINNTIIINDKVQQKTKEQNLKKKLILYTWGKIENNEKTNEMNFKLGFNQLKREKPEDNLINFDEYLGTKYTNSEEDQAKRQIEIDNFLKPGYPGSKLKPEFDKINRVLNLPKHLLDNLRKLDNNEAINDEEYLTVLNELKLNFEDEKYFIIPSFFRTWILLKKEKREFSIIFRTFGHDIEEIIKEFNYFCKGLHPCFNGKNGTPLIKFDGSKGVNNFIIENHSQGFFIRKSEHLNNSLLIFGIIDRINSEENLYENYSEQLESGSIKVYKLFNEIYSILYEKSKLNNGIAIKDDYNYFSQDSKKSINGKLFIIDKNDYDVLPIFFDDHIETNEKSIVDCWDISQNKRIDQSEILNINLVKADVIKAIQDNDYFIKNIELCEKNRKEEILKIENKFNTNVKTEENEYKKMMELSNNEYLNNYIYPLLNSSLKIIENERPDDPISLIAHFILKNKDKVKIPKKPIKKTSLLDLAENK